MRMRSRLRKAVVVGVALVVTSTLLIGCGARSSLRVGWVANDGPTRRRARYTSFSGLERASFRAEAGEMIEIEYEVEVAEGTLTIELLDPEGDRVVYERFEEHDSDMVAVSAPRSGRYRLRIEGEKTRGRYDVSWEVGSP